MLLVLLVSGLARGYQRARAIAHWAKLHADELLQLLPALHRIPSGSTLLRTLRQLDGALGDRLVTADSAGLSTATDQSGCMSTPHGEVLQGQALAGKTVRAASAHGDKTHLLSLVHRGSAITLGQTEVATKPNAISATPLLLRGRDLHGTVITGDALLTQRTSTQQICAQGGHDLLMVTRNQRQLWEDLALVFRIPSIPADQEVWDRTISGTKGHGRRETRTLDCGTALVQMREWPGLGHVLRRTCARVACKRGKRMVEVRYGNTSLTPSDARAIHVERLWRGHWTIATGKQYVRDVTLGEDRNQLHRGAAPRVLASLRSGLIDLWRWKGWRNIADAVRECAASVPRTLMLIGPRSESTLT